MGLETAVSLFVCARRDINLHTYQSARVSSLSENEGGTQDIQEPLAGRLQQPEQYQDDVQLSSHSNTRALTLFGASSGIGVVWYTSQFYSLYFIQTILKVQYLDSLHLGPI